MEREAGFHSPLPAPLNIAAVAGGQNTIITLPDTMDRREEENERGEEAGDIIRLQKKKREGCNTEKEVCKGKEEKGEEIRKTVKQVKHWSRSIIMNQPDGK